MQNKKYLGKEHVLLKSMHLYLEMSPGGCTLSALSSLEKGK